MFGRRGTKGKCDDAGILERNRCLPKEDNDENSVLGPSSLIFLLGAFAARAKVSERALPCMILNLSPCTPATKIMLKVCTHMQTTTRHGDQIPVEACRHAVQSSSNVRIQEKMDGKTERVYKGSLIPPIRTCIQTKADTVSSFVITRRVCI